jgi:hypothetical protein
MPGGSSIDVPPDATPASCQAFTCSGLSILKPIVEPLPVLAASPFFGGRTMNSAPLWR